MDVDLNRLRTELLVLDAEAKQAEARAAEAIRKAGRKLREIKTAIRNGAKTGDKVKDFAIVGGFDGGVVEAIYRGLNERLKNRTGEAVILITREEKDVFRYNGAIASKRFTREEEEMYFGILSDDSLAIDIRNMKCELPTRGYAHYFVTWGDEVKFEEGNIPSPRKGFIDLRDGSESRLEIVVGDNKVMAWFKKPQNSRCLGVFKKMALALSEPTIESTGDLPAELRPLRADVAKRITEFIIANRIIDLVKERERAK